jgi:putative ABC transport system ATP-binding protein
LSRKSLECPHRGRFSRRRNAAKRPVRQPDNGRFLVAEQRWIVRVQGVHRYFRRGSERLDVLKDLTLNVPEGDFLGLMGPSGSGKTTLLNLIAGLDKPSEGQVWVGDELISSMSEGQLAHWRTRHVGFIFQFYHLMPVLTAYENVELPLLLLPLSARQRREQVMTALDLVGLSDRVRHRPGQLSGGQQQRVGIARAIVTDPTLIVADEPTGDLDARSADEILNLLDELRRSLHKTILLVTHDPRAAQRADRILHLEKGQLVEQPEVLHDAAAGRGTRSPASAEKPGFYGCAQHGCTSAHRS